MFTSDKEQKANNPNVILKNINNLKHKVNSKFYCFFAGSRDIYYDKLCEHYEQLINICLIDKNYFDYYKYMLEYNSILESRYNTTYDLNIKSIQYTNIKALLEKNIYDRLSATELTVNDTYYKLIDMYVSYAEQTCDTGKYAHAVEKIIKLYMINPEKYECNIFAYLDKYYIVTCNYHKHHAELLCKHKQYASAINIYQSYIDSYITDNCLKYMVPSYIYMMMLCYMLVGDDIATSKAYVAVTNNYPTLEYNYEYKFTLKIVDAYLKKDIDNLTHVIAEQDALNKLTDIQVEMLLIIKRKLDHNDDDLC